MRYIIVLIAFFTFTQCGKENSSSASLIVGNWALNEARLSLGEYAYDFTLNKATVMMESGKLSYGVQGSRKEGAYELMEDEKLLKIVDHLGNGQLFHIDKINNNEMELEVLRFKPSTTNNSENELSAMTVVNLELLRDDLDLFEIAGDSVELIVQLYFKKNN